MSDTPRTDAATVTSEIFTGGRYEDFRYVNPEDMADLERENNRMRWLFRQILLDMPKNRDWLNPDYEREMREWTKNPD